MASILYFNSGFVPNPNETPIPIKPCFQIGDPFSCKGKNFQLSSLDPAYQYITQKRIQNTVRVPSSLYTMNVGALANYQSPVLKTRVNWNQMSDRAVPHYQSNSGRSQGSTYHGSSLRSTQTRDRPGAQTPGGYGVDIKHNSYYRYLNRLKGGKLLRRGVIPKTYGLPIPFDPAFPVYGGKTVKTAIVTHCSPRICPRFDREREFGDEDDRLIANSLAFERTFDEAPFNITYQVGDKVYARTSLAVFFQEAVIVSQEGDYIYTVRFDDNVVEATLDANAGFIIPYFPCYCKNDQLNLSQSIALKYLFKECTALNVFNSKDNENFLNSIAPLLKNYRNFGTLYESFAQEPNYTESIDLDLYYNTNPDVVVN
jgi:hypothetical protein